MTKKTKIIFAFFIIAGMLVISGCGCKPSSGPSYKLSLEIWGPLDSADFLNESFENYKKINPNISTITYKKISGNTYRQELLDAMASGQGPDIFLMSNTWLPSFEDKISSAPQIQDSGVLNERKFRDNFVDVAADDFLSGGNIYAVPLAVNTLGLFYNKDLFNQAGITDPPKDWNEFISDVRKLTKFDPFNKILQSGAAIGTAYNINRSTDILNLLMLQTGTEMIDDQGRVKFDSAVSDGVNNVSPGENALNFYTQFANSGSLNYTWNSDLHYSLDAFSEGDVAMMFNYPWNIQTVLDKAPKLNFDIAPVPQFENRPKVNYASYWAFAVAKNKIPKSDPYGNNQTAAPISNDTRIGEAWRFLTYLTTKPDGTFVPKSSSSEVGNVTNTDFDPAIDYLIKSKEPAARRDLVEKQKTDTVIGIFAADNLIAKSWKQPDADAVSAIFAEMIDQVNKGEATVLESLKTAAKRVQGLTGQY